MIIPTGALSKKTFGVALHFREHPELADNALTIMQAIGHDFNDWQPKRANVCMSYCRKVSIKAVPLTMF